MACHKEQARIDDLQARLAEAQEGAENGIPGQTAVAQNLGRQLLQAGQALQRSRLAASGPLPSPPSPCAALQTRVDDLLAQYNDAKLDCNAGNHAQCGRATILLQQLGVADSKLQSCLNQTPPGPVSNLVIAGVEQTQATQFFLINGQGSAAAANNSVVLVASKPLALRVYVNQTAFPGIPIPGYIAGEVTVAGSAPIDSVVPIPSRPANTINRGNVNHTLNFQIPAGLCRKGAVVFTVSVFDIAHPGDPAYAAPPLTFTLYFSLFPSMNLHGVLINYTGPGVKASDPPLNIPAPTTQQLVDSLSFISRVYPISSITIGGTEVAKFNGNLANQQGSGCGLGWTQLLNMLANMKAASGSSAVYVGLLPIGTPRGSYTGCGGNGAAAAFVNDGPTLAQEIAHVFGRMHAPCGGPATVDPNYPAYGHYPSGSIGEFGFDTLTNKIYDPAASLDFMSYCSPPWVSPYTYAGLRASMGAALRTAGVDQTPEHGDSEGEYLYLNFRFHEMGRVEMLPSFHLRSIAPAACRGRATPVRCDLLGDGDKILHSHRCHLSDPHMCPDAPELLLRAVIPWDPETRAIAFRRGLEVVYRHELEEAPAEVAIDMPQGLRERAGMMRIQWKPATKVAKAAKSRASQAATYVLRYSHDGGATWRAIAADLTDPQADINLDMLPGGQDCRFQVVASSGIRTTLSESGTFSIPVKPVQAYLFEPADGAVFLEGESIVLRGSGFSPNHQTPPFEDLIWSSRLDGQIGVGFECAVSNLRVGRHQITLSMPDGVGGEATAGVFIEVRSGD